MTTPVLPPVQPPSPPRTGFILAIVALVLSVFALLGVIAIAIFFVVMGAMGTSLPLMSGQVSPTQGYVTEAELEAAIDRALDEEWGEDSYDIQCPASSRVAEGLTAVCSSSQWGTDYAEIVFFEDDKGTFTLFEY